MGAGGGEWEARVSEFFFTKYPNLKIFFFLFFLFFFLGGGGGGGGGEGGA